MANRDLTADLAAYAQKVAASTGSQKSGSSSSKSGTNGRSAARVNGERTTSTVAKGPTSHSQTSKSSSQAKSTEKSTSSKNSSGKQSLTGGGLQLGAGLTGAASAKAQAAVEDVKTSEDTGLQLGQWDPKSLVNRNLTKDNHPTASSAVQDADKLQEMQQKVDTMTSQDKTYWSDWDWMNYEQAKQELKSLTNPKPAINNWEGRDSLIRELQDIDRDSIWITDPQEATRTENRRRAIVNTLETNDALAGNGVQSYSDVHRARQIAGAAQGAAEQGSGVVVQSVTTLLDQLLGGPAEELKNLIGITIDDLTGGRTNIQGMKNPITALNDWVHRTNEEEQQYYASRAGNDKTLNAINKYGTMTAAALPMSVVAVMSGGTSLGPEALAATAAINESTGLSQLALMTSNAVRGLAANPNTQIAFVQALGSGFDDAKADGATDEEATVYSIINATYNALIEVGGGDEALGGLQKLPKLVREALAAGEKMPVIQYAKSIVSEVGEENMQGIMERGLKTIYQDVPIGIDPYVERTESGGLKLGAVNNLQNENAVISIPQMKEEAIGAAIVSALLGGGQFAVEKAIDTATRQGFTNEQIRQMVMDEMARRAAAEGEQAAELPAENMKPAEDLTAQETAQQAAAQEKTEEMPAGTEDTMRQAEIQETPDTAEATNGYSEDARQFAEDTLSVGDPFAESNVYQDHLYDNDYTLQQRPDGTITATIAEPYSGPGVQLNIDQRNFSTAQEALAWVHDTTASIAGKGTGNETIQQNEAQEKQGLLGPEEEGAGTGEAPAGGGQPDASLAGAAAGTEAAVGAGKTPADGDAGRLPGGRTGGQGRRLDSDAGTGSGIAGTAGRGGQGAGSGIRNALREAGVRSVSSQELGLANGTTQQTLQIVPEEMWESFSATRKGEATATDNLRALAYSINMTTGCTVDFVTGPIGITGTDGRMRYANGFFDTDARRIVVRVDSTMYSPQQIAKHEEFHALAKLYPKLVTVVRSNILEQYGRQDLINIIRTYQEKRRGINDIRSGRADLFSKEAEELLEEIFADANGLMNAFDAGATKYWAGTRKGIADQQDRAYSERLKAAATARRTGPPEAGSVVKASVDELGADASTNVNTETKGHTPEEIDVIKEYQAATDNDLAEFALDVLMSDSDEANGWFYALEPVSDRAAADMQRITGVDAHGYRQGIHGSRINHIDIHHGKRSGGDKSMKDINDVARMQYIIDHYDNAEPGKGTSAYRTNRKDGTQGPSKTVVFSKKVDNTYYLVEAVPDTAAKTVYVVSAYMQKNNPGGENAADANAPTRTAKTEGSQTPGAADSITPEGGNGNKKFSFDEENNGKWKKYNGVEEEAVRHFGTTADIRTAGYVLPDGTMLDFSGAHWLEGYDAAYLADWRKKNDIRQVDHEDIYEAFEEISEDPPSDSSRVFIERGNIRMSPEAPGIELSADAEPTPEQYAVIRKMVRETSDARSFYVDLMQDGRHGKKKLSYEGGVNADRVVNDIRHYFQTGEIRQQSEVARFRFSLSEEDDGNEWYQMSLDDISNGDLARSEMHPAFREKLENADELTRRVQDVFRNMDKESELWMSPDEIEDAMDFNAWQSNLTLGDMHGSDAVLQRLADLAAAQDGDDRTETYELMEDILPHLDATYRERWTGMDERREPIDRDFAEWYNDKHPSLYYPGYTPGELFEDPENVEREIRHLEELMESGRLDEDDDSEAWILHDGLEYSLNYYNEYGHFPRHEIYYSVDEDSNLFGEELEEETEVQPEEPETASLPGAKYGSSDVTFNDTEEVPFRWAVVPLDSLTVSNDVHGNINKAYPQELQPRDRTRLDSLNQTQKIANNLIPQKLEADSSIQNGAPVIRSDGVVVSGNGRSLAMMMAYDRGKAAGYVEYLKKNAAKWGLDPADIPDDKPVLVRVAADGQDWTQLARDANVSTIAGKSASEQARTDARNLSRHPDVLDKLVTDEDGNLNIPANRDFISDFIQSVIPENERNEMHTPDGLLTQDGLTRVQRAIFESAYGDADLLERLSERLDNDMKNVTNALLAAAPNVVAYENAVTNGTRYDVNLRDRVLEAVRIYTDAKQNGQTVAQRTANLGIDEAPNEWSIYIARFIEQEKASGKQLRTMFNSLSETADELGDPNQIGFFGDEEEERNFGQVLEGAIRQYEDISGRQLPGPERWGAGTLEEVSETAGLRGQSLRDYYLTGEEDEGGRDARADHGRDGIGEEESGRPVREGSAPLTAEDGNGRPDMGRRGGESGAAREPGSLRVGEAEELPFETEEKPQPSEGTRRILEEKRRDEKQIAQAKKKGPQRGTKFPDYNPVPEDSGKGFREIAGEIRSRAAAERAKRLEHIQKEKFFGTEALQKLGVKIEGALGNYTGTKQLREIERAARQLKTEIRRQEKNLNATDKEKQMARGMAAGIYTMEDFGPNVRREIINTLADYYEYERTINDDMVLQRRRDINAQLEDQIQTMLPDDPGYKIPPMFVLNHRTPERICRNIWGDEKGREVYEKIFRPVAVNEAEKIRWVKKQFDDVREIEGSDGKKSELTRDEAMLAQQVLEGRAAAELVAGMELEDGRERIESVAQNIVNGDASGDAAREFGLSDQERGIAEQYARWLQTKAIYDSGAFDTKKIDNAVEIYQEKYNLMYDAINDFLVAHGYKPIGFIRGYAPHMQMQEDLNLFAGYLKNLGINDNLTRLPANIAGRTADLKPNKRWNPYFLQRTGDTTDFDIAKGFQSYVTYMADVLYHTDDTMRIRALSRHYRALYAPDNIKENLSWAKYMNSTTPEVKREELQKRGILSRDAAMSEEEVNDAFDKWIEEQFASIENTTKYSDLVMYLDNYANILAGKQSMSDRGGEYDWGRESLTRANRIISAFARTQVAGNLSSAFSQLSQIPMIQAELGPKVVAQAVRDYANGTLRKAGFAQQSDHLTERAGSGALVTDRFDMVMEKMFQPLRLVDGFTAAIAVRAKYLQQIEAGKSHQEALKEADAYAKRVQGSRAKGSKPLAFHSKKVVNQMLHLFQLELFNSWEHVSQDLPADFREIERTQGKKAAAGALAKVILSYLMTAFLLNRLTEEAYGGTPAPFDLLGITSNFIASGYGLTANAYLETVMDNVIEKLFDKRIFETDPDAMRDEFKWTDAADGGWYEAGSDIPYLRNIMGLMGLGDQTLPIPLMGLGDELKYLVKDVRSDIENGKPSGQTGMDLLHIMNQLLPGGRQMTKTEEGLQLMMQGGRYVNGKLYYPVENTFGNWVKAMLFGRSALEESDAYYAGDDHALTVGATELYQMLTDEGSAGKREAYEALQTARNLNDEQTEWLREYGDGGGDTWAAWQTMQDYKAVSNDDTLGNYEKGRQLRAVITNAVLTDEERLELYRVMNKDNAGKADKLEAIMDTGLSWAQAVQAYDAYAEIEANENLSKKEQAEQWASWVNRQNYTAEQKDTIRDEIKFWGSYAIEETNVDKMTAAGLDPDAADRVTEILNGLEPEDGRDKVTDLQKYRAIVGSGLSEDEQWRAIIGITPESYTSTLDKITVMQDYGISPDVWTQSKQAMYDADDAGNNNDSTDQTEAKAALDGMNIPNEQKAILWQLTNKSWSWKKNPYDKDIGQEVYALMHDGDTGKSSSTKKSGKRGGGRRGGRGGKKAGGGLEVGAAFDSGHSGMFDSILLGWKRKKYSRAQILAMVKAGFLTQEEAEEILATMQETEAEETDGGLTLGAAEG